MNEPICKDNSITKIENNKLKQMVKISKILSSKFEFARIDFYLVKNKIYFGEITFTPQAGKIKIYPKNEEIKISKNG